jgi:GTP-binding protein EngB required for normal cell division/HPt (histidine-containing phosphotransfer) domain-containing protein
MPPHRCFNAQPNMVESYESLMPADSEFPLALAREVLERFELADLMPLLRVVESQATKSALNVAIFGRFNAGKSSFLNHLMSCPVLPVGVVPVTSVVTEICYGPEECASVIFRENRASQPIFLAEIASFTSEAENPRNCKSVELVRVSLPQLASFGNLKFVDTPGLESLFPENTEASLSWSPLVDLALVAVAADAPLTQQDLVLIERLRQFTPNVSVLLTKADILDGAGLREVLGFVQARLAARFPGGLRVFPFSDRPNHEQFRERFVREYLSGAAASFQAHRAAALAQKLQTLFRSMQDYLRLALKSALTVESDRERIRTHILGSEDSLADTTLQLQLLAKHAAARTRPSIELHFQTSALARLQQSLASRLASEFPKWRGSFSKTLSQFENWLREELTQELTSLSAADQVVLQQVLRDFQRRCRQALQQFRDQLSEKAMHALGIPLRTTEVEIEPHPPRIPDVSVGRIYDHDWELVSFLIPMPLVRGAVAHRFREKTGSEVFKNLSRLTSQWEAAIQSAIYATGKMAERRFDEFVSTVRRALETPDPQESSLLQAYLEKLEAASESLEAVLRDSS